MILLVKKFLIKLQGFQKIYNKIIQKQNPQKNSSETVTNELDKEIPTESYISPEERQEMIDELRLK